MYRSFLRKYDSDEPPSYEMDEDEEAENKKGELFDKYYKHGVRPAWLTVHRIVSHRQTRSGIEYLVKWRDLPYDQATWVEQNAEFVPDLQKAIEDYHVSVVRVTSLSFLFCVQSTFF
jgi:chromodomain-helicase-DNA-binding protein 4